MMKKRQILVFLVELTSCVLYTHQVDIINSASVSDEHEQLGESKQKLDSVLESEYKPFNGNTLTSNQTEIQLINQSTNTSIDKPGNETINQSIDKPGNETINRIQLVADNSTSSSPISSVSVISGSSVSNDTSLNITSAVNDTLTDVIRPLSNIFTDDINLKTTENILNNNNFTSIFNETKVENLNKNETQSENIAIQSINQLLSEIKNQTGLKDESINNVDGSNQTSVDYEKQKENHDKTEIPDSSPPSDCTARGAQEFTEDFSWSAFMFGLVLGLTVVTTVVIIIRKRKQRSLSQPGFKMSEFEGSEVTLQFADDQVSSCSTNIGNYRRRSSGASNHHELVL